MSHFSRFLTSYTFFFLMIKNDFCFYHTTLCQKLFKTRQLSYNWIDAECEIKVSSGWQCKWWIPSIDSMILVNLHGPVPCFPAKTTILMEGHCMSYEAAMVCPILTLLNSNMHMLWLLRHLNISMYSLYAHSLF
jgi:hypothetical protein